MSGDWAEAMLGRLQDNGEELELLGGLNFIGFTITSNNGLYDIEWSISGGISDNTIALAKLVNASAQYDFVMRNSSGAGAWERGTRANLVSAIDGQHVSTSFGAPFVKLGASGDTYPSSGLLRCKFTSNAGGGVVYMTGVTDDGLSTMSVMRYGVSAQYVLTLGDGVTANGVKGVNVRMLTGGPGWQVTIAGSDRWITTDTQHDAKSLPLVNLTKLNGATVFAPTEGTLADASATKNISDGAQLVLPAGTLTTNRTLTLGTSGSPITGETITVVRHDATANTYAVANGGGGGGTLFTFPASTKGVAAFKYDGTNWAWLGTFVRLQ